MKNLCTIGFNFIMFVLKGFPLKNVPVWSVLKEIWEEFSRQIFLTRKSLPTTHNNIMCWGSKKFFIYNRVYNKEVRCL